jgi:hypothetical protein
MHLYIYHYPNPTRSSGYVPARFFSASTSNALSRRLSVRYPYTRLKMEASQVDYYDHHQNTTGNCAVQSLT